MLKGKKFDAFALCLLNGNLQQEEKQFITYRKQFDLYG